MAHLDWGSARAQVDLRSPQLGVQLIRGTSKELALEILGVELNETSPPLSDVFVRGGDLVATYEQTAARPARVQIYWRQIGAITSEQLMFDLIVSVQTSLLDSWPSLLTRSSLPAKRVRRLAQQATRFDELSTDAPSALLRETEEASACVSFELNGSPACYVEMIHPSDFWRGSIAPRGASGGLTCGWELFPQHLEKGVILRARLRGALLRGVPSDEVLAEQHEAFLAEKLPLTV